jgi:hypothetical protein
MPDLSHQADYTDRRTELAFIGSDASVYYL